MALVEGEDMIIRFLSFLFLLCLIFGIGIGGWYIYRQFNYSFSYKSKVQETIREMVKPEALIGGGNQNRN